MAPGSERSGLSAQDGNPNVSLSLMSMIVKDIVSGCPRNNFRQSKLTHLLQPALTGRCKLGLVFTLNPCSSRGATSSVQFAKNMMKMPDAKIVRNPMTMTEAQVELPPLNPYQSCGLICKLHILFAWSVHMSVGFLSRRRG
jgi:hypothetical protein